MARYPGGKNVQGTFQRIINQIPPHEVYVEPFAGSAAIFRMKRQARKSHLIEKSYTAIKAIRHLFGDPSVELHFGCGIEWLCQFQGGLLARPDSVVYCDPPYLPETLESDGRYEHMLSTEQHGELLDVLTRCHCRVLLSGYWSRLYADRLKGWRSLHWEEITRGGHTREHWLWMNFAEPIELHDYRYVGDNYRERENLARMKRRWTAKIQAMPRLKRLAILGALQDCVAKNSATTGSRGGYAKITRKSPAGLFLEHATPDDVGGDRSTTAAVAGGADGGRSTLGDVAGRARVKGQPRRAKGSARKGDQHGS